MYCPKCGNQVSDGARFCPQCGYAFPVEGVPMPASAPAPQQGYAPAPAPAPQQAYAPGFASDPQLGQSPVSDPSVLMQQKLAQAASEGLGMNWYKFIIYVQCFLGALGALVTGISQMVGAPYGEGAGLVYTFYPGLRVVDVLYGLSSIAAGALLMYAWRGLRRFKASSVGVYLIIPIITTVAAIVYLIAASIIVRSSLLGSGSVSGGMLGAIVGNVGLLIGNYIYFNKRKHLFNEL